MNTGMVVVETQFPEDIFNALQAAGLFKEVLAQESRRLLALRFFRQRVLSLGKASRLAGLSRWEFVEFLSKNDVPVIDYSSEELAREFGAMGQLEAELSG